MKFNLSIEPVETQGETVAEKIIRGLILIGTSWIKKEENNEQETKHSTTKP